MEADEQGIREQIKRAEQIVAEAELLRRKREQLKRTMLALFLMTTLVSFFQWLGHVASPAWSWGTCFLTFFYLTVAVYRRSPDAL